MLPENTRIAGVLQLAQKQCKSEKRKIGMRHTVGWVLVGVAICVQSWLGSTSSKAGACTPQVIEIHPVAVDFDANNVGKVMLSTSQDDAYWTTVKTTKAALRQEIDQIVADISSRSPLTSDEARRADELLLSLNFEYDNTLYATNDFIKSLGIRAVPFLAEKLLAQEDDTREKAIIALGFLFQPHVVKEAGYQDTETALIALSERSILDRSACVRLDALGMLRGIGMSHWPHIPPMVIDALKSALDDPDPMVSGSALLYSIGLEIVEGPGPYPEGLTID